MGSISHGNSLAAPIVNDHDVLDITIADKQGVKPVMGHKPFSHRASYN